MDWSKHSKGWKASGAHSAGGGAHEQQTGYLPLEARCGHGVLCFKHRTSHTCVLQGWGAGRLGFGARRRSTGWVGPGSRVGRLVIISDSLHGVGAGETARPRLQQPG